MTQKLTDAMFTGTLASSKLTGAMGNNDGSELTGVGGDGATDSANDPAADTNPSGGVGTLWANHTSGELYVCTDATANANVWTNVGGGSGDVVPWFYGGTVSGYTAAGHPNTAVIEKFAFASTNNATTIGNLLTAKHAPGGNSSNTHGFACGGNPVVNVIQKFSFSAEGNAVDHGDLTRTCQYPTEPGAASETHGYTSGGNGGSTPTQSNVIDKFVFATNSNATDVGDLTTVRSNSYGQSSTTHGHSSSNTIVDRWAYASDGNATDVGALSVSGSVAGAGQSSTTHGYSSGAEPGTGPRGNVIDKFSFSSLGNATDVGNLTVGRGNCSGQSSTTHGYTAGGDNPARNTIDQFSFASDGNATDWGDLTATKGYLCGQHF